MNEIVRVSSKEFCLEAGRYEDMALAGAVVVMAGGEVQAK